MAKLRGLQLRGKTYYSRIVVPGALVASFGRRQIWKSLRTSDRAKAEALHLKEAAFWSAAFAQAGKAGRPPSAPVPGSQPMDNEQAAALARQFFASARAGLDYRESPAGLDEEQREAAAADVEWELSALRSWRDPDAHRLVGEARGQVLQNKPGPPGSGGSTSELLAELLRRALVQLGSFELARLRGDYRDQITDSFFNFDSRAARPDCTPPTGGPLLGGCIDRFQREVLELRAVTPKTRLKHQSLLKHIGAHFGRNTPLQGITRADCNRFRDTLATLPPNFGKRAAGKKTLASIGSSNRSGRTLSWETQSNYLKMLSDLFAWAVRERLVGDNVAERIAPMKIREPAEAQRLPFSEAELKAIFSAPLFTGCVDDQRRFARRGPNLVRRSRYWLPLLALFTGMRMGELLQLTPAHVRRSASGTPFIVLTRDMKLKTGSAEREIPVHGELVKLGFLEWVEDCRQSGTRLLFEDVPESRHGYRSDTFTKRFASFLRTVDLSPERRGKLCFHSFRHTFKDALNETGAGEEVKDEICGWARSKKTGRRYGTGLSAEQLADAVGRVDFGLDLSALVSAVEAASEPGLLVRAVAEHPN